MIQIVAPISGTTVADIPVPKLAGAMRQGGLILKSVVPALLAVALALLLVLGSVYGSDKLADLIISRLATGGTLPAGSS